MSTDNVPGRPENVQSSTEAASLPVSPKVGEVHATAYEALKPRKVSVKIDEVAAEIGLQKEKVTLPNGREVTQIVWKPEHLSQVFQACDRKRQAMGLGKLDVVVVDGVCPTWLLPAITHAFHPTQAAVSYPQGGPDAMLPISGTDIEGAGAGKDLSFKMNESDDAVTVEFSLTAPQIDAQATLNSLVAPKIPTGKPVRITGRGPIAIAAALAEAYAHRASSVSCFQPGTGHVTCISHDAKQPLGTVNK